MSGEGQPRMLILAGPNGAGKTTFSRTLLEGENGRLLFLNADIEARNLLPGDVSSVAVPAGRIVLEKMKENLRELRSFAIETTLSGRIHLKYVIGAVSAGWQVDLNFLWLDSAELAHQRVAARVAAGGHDIPGSVISRRYFRGMQMLPVYCKEVSMWTIFDNSDKESAIVASGSKNEIKIESNEKFQEIKKYWKEASHDTQS